MKIYKRQIRPMVVPPVSRCINCKPYPLMPENYWYEEQEEEVLRPLWEKNVKKRGGGQAKLEIEERYVEVEPPIVEIENFKPGDTIIITIDPNIIDVDTVQRWVDSYTVAYPQCDVWVKFKGIDIAKK